MLINYLPLSINETSFDIFFVERPIDFSFRAMLFCNRIVGETIRLSGTIIRLLDSLPSPAPSFDLD